MAKKEQKKFAEEEQEERKPYDPTVDDKLRLGGAWKNEDKQGNPYLVMPLNTKSAEELILLLQESLKTPAKNEKDTIVKIITYTNGYRTDEKHPHFIGYGYPVTTKPAEE